MLPVIFEDLQLWSVKCHAEAPLRRAATRRGPGDVIHLTVGVAAEI
jgi:hypothetical protein